MPRKFRRPLLLPLACRPRGLQKTGRKVLSPRSLRSVTLPPRLPFPPRGPSPRSTKAASSRLLPLLQSLVSLGYCNPNCCDLPTRLKTSFLSTFLGLTDQPAEDFNSLEAEFLRINARFQQALKAKIQQCRENVNDKKQRLANLEGECESIRLLIVDLKRQQMESEEKMEAIKVTVLEAKEAVEIAERELKETVNKQKH